jgi:hypothetical protein
LTLPILPIQKALSRDHHAAITYSSTDPGLVLAYGLLAILLTLAVLVLVLISQPGFGR